MVDKKYKTFSNRLFAVLIDSLILMPLLIIGDYLASKKGISILWLDLATNIVWITYIVIGHGKYGQTIGKRLMGIKVLKLDEQNVIGYKKAFYRESIWFLATLVAILYLTFRFGPTINDPGKIEDYQNLNLFFSLGWLVIELTTMLMNNKRRAMHDLIAGSVVVNLKALKK